MLALEQLRLLALAVLFFFIASGLILHLTLTSLEDPSNLLQKTSDWQRAEKTTTTNLTVRNVFPKKPVQQVPLMRQGPPPKKLPALRKQRGRSRRAVFEADHSPLDRHRIRQAVEALRLPPPATLSNMTYDIRACPPTPPLGYPMEWSLPAIVTDWNPDDTEIPSRIYQGLCVFDYDIDGDKITAYREAEVPFVLENHPEMASTVERWNSPNYLSKLLGDSAQRNEHRLGNHFMFWRTKGLKTTPQGWKPPTDNVELTYDEWRSRAEQLEQHPDTDAEHWYFRLNAAWPDMNPFLYDELPVFRPDNGPSLMMVEPEAERGINCRLGMRGVIAESHFDPTRNWILVLGGQRRYILSHPRECRHLELYPKDHPSGRHSMLDWSDLPQDVADRPFGQARANEVVLQAGDALYLPTSWFHYIVSLNINYQCNARSGATTENLDDIRQCGFPVRQ